MGNGAALLVDIKSMHTDAALRELLRIARRHQHLSQREAAAAAHVSLSWWKRVERTDVSASPDTLLDMLQAVGARPGHLTRAGHRELAGLLTKREVFSSDGETHQNLQDYLARAPASDEMRQALMITARTMGEIEAGRAAALPADEGYASASVHPLKLTP